MGVAGAMGLGAAVSTLTLPKAQAAILQSEVPNLSSIGDLKVTRDEKFDVPGGKEQFVEWLACDGNGVTKKFLVHHTRIDADVSYTISTNVVIHTYSAGSSIDSKPVATSEQNITVYAVKGEVSGSVRNDHLTITTVHRDGSSSRLSQIVPVKLDNSEYADMDTATIIRSIGRQFLGPHS